jgi:poly(3-hydroxybutyrate) depolymerase
MYLRSAFFLIFINWLIADAQTINLRGKISNSTGQAVSGAVVSLSRQSLKDTTGSDGIYELKKANVSVIPLQTPLYKSISLKKNSLEFSLPEPSPVQIEIFDINGNRLKKKSIPTVSTGFYRFDIKENSLTAKLLVIRASIGPDGIVFRYVPSRNGTVSSFNTNIVETLSSCHQLTKITAISDTIKVSASGFNTKSVPVSNYDQTLNITLDSSNSNDAGRSAGCGKSTTLKNESRLKLSSGGKDREYIIRLPADYDQNTAYRLIVSIHCLNGTAAGVASGGSGNNYQYYGLWKFANPTNGKGTTIFVSPEGLPAMGSGLGWSNSGGSDVTFIRALVSKIETDLCIDTTRIFAEGFSMGGSMSYALACAMPKKFRAVCMHSGGSMSGCDGTNRGPVPMFITHGTNDNVCKWSEHWGQDQINDLAKRNGCEEVDLFSTCKPTDQTGMTPVTVNYKNCKPGYPCKACIFVGDHNPSPGGEKNTWVDDSTWNFFKQF